MELPEEVKKELLKAHYGVYNHSTVEVCHWTKKALKKQGTCYKNKFYGIETHRCMEFSPAGMWCTNNCIYCWRPMEFMKYEEFTEFDEPQDIINHLIEERRRLLSGFKGDSNVDIKLWEEAQVPTHFAISLSGEPTLYPKLPELINYLKSLPQTKSIFLVTNGQLPEMLERLQKENALPTQLYLSMTAPNEELYKKISIPIFEDAWERFLKSLKFLSNANTRTVIRMTIIKNYNDCCVDEYAKLIQMGNPHFVEVKSYIHIGRSIHRLSSSNMLTHEEVVDFTNKLLEKLPNFEFMDEQRASRITVIQNKNRKVDRWIIPPQSS